MLRKLARAVAGATLTVSALAALPALAQKVKLATSMGDIVIELDAARPPRSAANFVQ